MLRYVHCGLLVRGCLFALLSLIALRDIVRFFALRVIKQGIGMVHAGTGQYEHAVTMDGTFTHCQTNRVR